MKYLFGFMLLFNVSFAQFNNEFNVSEVTTNLDCEIYKDKGVEDKQNKSLLKCLTYKKVFDKYGVHLDTWNANNLGGNSHQTKIKPRNVWSKYIAKKGYFKLKKESYEKREGKISSMQLNISSWELEAFSILYNSIQTFEPVITDNYKQEIQAWIEKYRFNNKMLSELFENQVASTQKSLWWKEQYHINASFTILETMYEELQNRGISKPQPTFNQEF